MPVLVLVLVASGCGPAPDRATTAMVGAPTSTGPRLLRTLPWVEQTTAAPLVLAGDAHHLFWTSTAGIVAADADAGAPRTLVADVFVTAMAIVDGALVYQTGTVAWRIPLAGGTPRRLERGAPGWAALRELDQDVRVSDSLGDVAVAADGAALVLHTADRPRQLVFPQTAGHRWLPRPPVLIGADVIAADVDLDGNTGLWRLPRRLVDAPTLMATTDGAIDDLIAVDGALTYVEVHDGDELTDLPVRALVHLAADGARTVLARAPAFAAIAADAQAAAYAVAPDDYPGSTTIWLAEAGAAPRQVVDAPGSEVVGLALAPRALYWIQDGAIWTAPRTGGRPSRFHEPAWGDAGGSGTVHLVVDGASVYFSSVGLGATGVHRTRGGADATELWPPPEEGMGDELIQVGGALFVVVGHRALWRVPMDGGAARAIFAADDDSELLTVVGGGDTLYVSVRASGAVDVLALDPTTGARRAALHTVADDLVGLAADHDALYLALDQPGWVVRVAHPRP